MKSSEKPPHESVKTWRIRVLLKFMLSLLEFFLKQNYCALSRSMGTRLVIIQYDLAKLDHEALIRNRA